MTAANKYDEVRRHGLRTDVASDGRRQVGVRRGYSGKVLGTYDKMIASAEGS